MTVHCDEYKPSLTTETRAVYFFSPAKRFINQIGFGNNCGILAYGIWFYALGEMRQGLKKALKTLEFEGSDTL